MYKKRIDNVRAKEPEKPKCKIAHSKQNSPTETLKERIAAMVQSRMIRNQNTGFSSPAKLCDDSIDKELRIVDLKMKNWDLKEF